MSLLALLVLAAWLVVLTVGFDVLVRVRLRAEDDTTLRLRAQAVAATLVISGGRIDGVREAVDDGALDSSVWIFAGSAVLERPAGVQKVQRAAQSLAHAAAGTVDSSALDVRFLVSPVLSDGTRLGTVLTAVSTDPTSRAIGIIVVGSGLVSILLLAGAYPVLHLAAGRALRPVDRMTRQAADWSVTEPERRLHGRQHFAELALLAGTLDEMLDRVSGVLRHERSMSAELSHELRTPITRILAEADLRLAATPPPPGADRAAFTAIRDSALGMERIVATLLAAARSDGAALQGRCDLGAALQVACSPLLTERPGLVRITTSAQGRAPDPAGTGQAGTVFAGVDARVVKRIVAPVLENARRFARTRIDVHSRAEQDVVFVDIANDGPPIGERDAEEIFEPGRRGDPVSTGDGHDGSGLGLALARRLARAADGDLVLSTRDPVVFTVRLPPS